MASFELMLKKVGSRGRYQFLVLFLMMAAKMFPGIITVLPVLSGGYMDHTCKLPNGTLAQGINLTAEKCNLVYNNTITGEIDRKPCTEWDFSQEQYISTLRSAYNLVCDREYLMQLSNTFFFVGFMIGCTLYGHISDTYGRMVGIIAAVIHLCIFSTATSFAPNYWSYVILRFITGIGNGGQLTTLFTMAAEVTDPQYRTIWLMTVQNGWAIGVCLLALIGYFVRNHMYIQMIMGIPICLLLTIFLIIYESPRWLYGTGRIDKADEVMRKIAKINKREIDENFTLRETYRTYRKSICSEKDLPKSKTRAKFVDIFKYPGLRKITLLVWLNWFVISMGYFAMIFMLEGLGGNVYVNLAALSIVEIPARALGLFTSIKFGRRYSLVFFYAMGGVACLACAALYGKPGLHIVLLVVAICGQFFFSVAFDLIWMYSAEVFPTVIRNVGVGVGSTWARVGGMIAPQIGLLKTFWVPLPFIVLGMFPIIASIGSFFLPETRGRTLAETLEEGELLFKGKPLPESKTFDDDEENDEEKV